MVMFKLDVSFNRRLSNRVIKIMCDADRRNKLINFYGREDLREVVPTVGNVLKNIDALEESNV